MADNPPGIVVPIRSRSRSIVYATGTLTIFSIRPNESEPEPAARAQESTPFSRLTGWVRQGTESFFATQRILLDLVMRQNTNTFSAVRERLAGAGTVPVTALTEMAGEGISNFIAAQRVLLQLAQRQNEIVLGGVKERTPGRARSAP